MSAQIIRLPARRPAADEFADPTFKWLQGAAVAWMQADRAGKSRAEKAAALSAAKAAPTPGEAEILKLLRRMERRLGKMQASSTGGG